MGGQANHHEISRQNPQGPMMGTDKYRLSSLIDYYLKHVSSLFLSKYAGVSNESTEDNDKLDDTLSFIENDLVSYLSSKGIDPAILKNLRAIQQNIAMSETTSFIKKSGIDSEQPTSDTKESTPQSPIGTPNFTKPVKQPGNKPGGSYFPKTPYSQTPGEQAGFPEGHGFPRQAGKKEGTPGHPFFGLRKNHSENKSETGRSGPSDSAMEAETDKYKNGGDHHAKTPSSVPGESSAPTAGGTRLPAKASGTQSPGMQPSVPRSGRSTKQKKKTYPKGILRPSDTRTQVQREISRAIRYGTPFSCISLSIMDIDDGSGFRPILESDTFDLVTALYETIRKQIRDIDLIGSLGSKGPEHLLFVLAETEVDGANVVLERIRKVIEDSEFNSGDNSCKMLVTLSSIQYNVKRKPKWATFLRNFRDVQKNAMRENDD